MSLKKYKKSDKNIHNLTPRKIISNHERQFWLYEDGLEDYYDWWGYYYCDWYEAERRDEFVVPVYEEYNSFGKYRRVLVGQYWPSETWIDDATRRNRRIEVLLGDDYVGKNIIANYFNRCH